MNRKILFLLIVFLALPSIVHAVDTFVVQETEKVSLQLNISDPDADKLTITYAPPLDENGEWQTSYGDAGEYKPTITVSDGITSVSKQVSVIVKKKEESPKIEDFSPKQKTLSIDEGTSIDFSILATDLNKDELSYEWFLDGKKARDGEEFSYATTYNDEGTHKILVEVSDGATTINKEWKVNVANVDVESLLNEVKDISANENNIVSLDIPDFEKYDLSYTISDPIGNDNEWQTGYDDSGSYKVRVHVEGKGFRRDKIVNVVINNVDREPIFEKIGNQALNENEELKIILNANDPDGDEITYSANNMPEGSELKDVVFTWKPSYDIVKVDNLIDKVLNKFGMLSKSKSFNVQFVASSKDKKSAQDATITVKDANQPPILEDIGLITITEEDTLRISPNAYDLDGDRVSLSYSGFINTNVYKSDFDDAGTYHVKVTASDGLYSTSKLVEIKLLDNNRAPVFSKIKDIKASEGDNIAIALNANDPDGDKIEYSIDNAPEGSSFEGNIFYWTPGFDVSRKKETKEFNLVFVASDSKTQTKQIAKIEISNKNRAPRIINATSSITAKANKPVLMFVKATDDDGDSLIYTWKFGLLESYKATPTHQRIFTSTGTKTVKVIVSDDIDKVEQLINVNVV